MDTPAKHVSDAKFLGVILGAALGDALGWPYENRARNASVPKRAILAFSDWTKRSGGKFQPHEETIHAGHYSDDTQLIIAVSRALLNADDWWSYFATVELPLWTLYQRGGGGATIRAAKAWAKQIAPWEMGTTDRGRYFQAGGNGVAMRISPHVLAGVNDPFEAVAKTIIIDGVTTHGHPQALVGALVYGFALWVALRNDQKLEYGQLVRELQNNRIWSEWPNIESAWPNWREIADQHGFSEAWAETVRVASSQIAVVMNSLEAGALSLDHETLAELGCFDKKILGAGTVAASAAVYLASRYAAGPLEGVTAAAFASGADTDTIASMTGALAGAINGADWLGALASDVQDYEFLVDLARKLQRIRPNADPYEPVNIRYLENILRELDQSKEPISMPRGFPTSGVRADLVKAQTQKLQARSWIVKQPGKQTIVIKKLTRPSTREESASKQEAFGFAQNTPSQNATVAGIGLFAADLEQSVSFYHQLLGLPIARQTSKLTQLGTHLVLRQSSKNIAEGSGTIVYVQVNDLDERLKLLLSLRLETSEIEHNGNRRSFSCRDPDGRTVEVFQR